MPASAGAAGSAAAGVAMQGGNPFQLATNLYAEKNNVGIITSQVLTAAQFPSGGQINAGQYLRGLRLILRTVTAGTGAVTAGATVSDFPWNILTQTDLVNVDGSEILYVMGGYAHYIAQKYGRPWLGDPATYADAVAATATIPQFTLFLQPEIRWTAGCLANTDTRSQYRYDTVLDTITNIIQGGSAWATTAPTLSLTPYLDAWAQPDASDLQGTPNQPVPPGLNVQYKRRHQIFTLNAAGSDNIMQSALTGNALRNQILITRTSAAGLNRIEALTDPLLWQIDNRSLGKISINRPSAAIGSPGGDLIGVWDSETYIEYFNFLTAQTTITAGLTLNSGFNREVGVYVFPRFLKPGSLYGQGWLYTANSPLALDTPVETRAGWKRIDDVLAGDEVLGSDHRWTPVLGVSKVFTGRDCYRLTIGGEQIICDGEHRWPTIDAHGVDTLRTTAELAKGGTYQITGHEKIDSIEPVPSVPTKCLATGRDDHLFLVGRTHIPTRNTKEIFESTSAAGLPASSTAELISDELYPVGPVDPQLTDI